MDDTQIEQKFRQEISPPERFPAGEWVLPPMPYRPEILARVDELLAAGRCPEGRLELETGEARLTCLIHHSVPFLAGLVEKDVYSPVPLANFAVRAAQLEDPVFSLQRTDAALTLMAAVHFYKRPILQGTSNLVDPAHVLHELAAEEQDAALSFQREGTRVLVFLNKGHPARLFFPHRDEDPGEGTLLDRILLYAFAPESAPCHMEVFTDLKLPADPDAGATLVELAKAAKPPPPADVCVHLADGREVRRRPFTPPKMIIGRDPTVDLFIDNLAVSRKHARLVWERGGFVIEDLASANGVTVNGKRVDRAPISAEDRIEIGKFEISLFEHASQPIVSETMLMKPVDAPAPGYLVADDQTLPLDRDVIIGKGEGVDALAHGWFLRPVHARLSLTREGVFSLTCFGGGQVRVGGKRVRKAELSLGDRFEVGRTRFRLTAKPGGRAPSPRSS